MTKQTKIEWCDFTVNVAEGCQKVGPGCDNCYAEARDIRFTGGSHWGPGAPRRYVKAGIPNLRKINRISPIFEEEHGRKPRVFFSSLSDVFDNAWPKEWRTELFTEIEAATDIHALMLTKRIGNVFQMVPPAWVNDRWPQHVGLMITVVNQDEANRDIPKLLELKAKYGIPWVGLSVEPMLGQIDLSNRCNGHFFANWLAGTKWHDGPGLSKLERGGPFIDWVICGGESGPNARPMHPDWARSLRDQCKAAGTAFFFKQHGRWLHESQDPNAVWDWEAADERGILHCWNFDSPRTFSIPLKKSDAGRLLDGVEHNGFPAAFTTRPQNIDQGAG